MNQSPVGIEALRSALQEYSDLPVTFSLGGKTIAPGYHLTEVKYASVDSLDCGQGQDHWYELIIQLLDGHVESKRGFLPASKFLSILEKAGGREAIADATTQLFFEFAPGNTALQKVSVQSIEALDGQLEINLNSLAPQCKAFERALGSMRASAPGSCCG